MRVQRLHVNQIYVDLWQAYDSIRRDKLLAIVIEFEISPRKIASVKATVPETIAKLVTELVNKYT